MPSRRPKKTLTLHDGRRIRAGKQPQARAESEAQFERRVVAAATARGWRIFHDHNSMGNRYDSAGFPDLVLVKRPPAAGRIIFAELKTDAGKPTPAQLAWLSDLERIAGVKAFIWRPTDWQSIIAELER